MNQVQTAQKEECNSLRFTNLGIPTAKFAARYLLTSIASRYMNYSGVRAIPPVPLPMQKDLGTSVITSD